MESIVKQQCKQCQATSTPKWRVGPEGPKTLCNACGLRYNKEKEKEKDKEKEKEKKKKKKDSEPKSKAKPQGQGESKAKTEASAQAQAKPSKGHYKALKIRASPY